MIANSVIRDFLTELEQQEARLLAWGVVDGGFSRGELTESAQLYLVARNIDETSDDLINELQRRRLIFSLRLGAQPVFKTRMAETVRLLSRLRQLFPNRPWRIAPTLVADYRFALQPRTYPVREIQVSPFLAQLET